MAIGQNAWPGWDVQLLDALGAPKSRWNLLFLDTWQNFEHSKAENNPLNITAPKGTSSINSAGVQNYSDRVSAITWTANAIKGYPLIWSILKSDSVQHTIFNKNTNQSLQDELRHWGSGTFADSIAKAPSNGFFINTPPNNVVPTTGQIAHDIAVPFESIGSLFKWMGQNWDRILFVIGGAILVILGIVLIGKQQANTFTFAKGGE